LEGRYAVRRKLTTLVAIDMVGYSRLLNEDEEAVIESLEILRADFISSKAEVYGGKIVRFLGDATLLYFDSALGAAEFAVDLQRSLAERNAAEPEQIPLVLRIGINLGDIITDDDDIHGDGLNIAVRLEALSEPGGICISESVYAQVKHKIQASFVSIGARSLKNMVDPVHVWRWRPTANARLRETVERLEDGSRSYRGQHLLDPRLVDVLLRLHARSVVLAVSDALDKIAEGPDDTVHLEQLYQNLGDELFEARGLLSCIRVERVSDKSEPMTNGGKQQTMNEFVAAMFSDSKIGYAFKILPEAQAIWSAKDTFLAKRKRFLALVRKFHNDDFIARSRRMIEYAYID
jgi:class 3 adenylate cyclase